MKITPIVIGLCAIATGVYAERIPVRLPSGEIITMKVASDDLAVLMAQVDAEIAKRDGEARGEFLLDFSGGPLFLCARANLAPRNFNASPTKKEIEDITFIINSLGDGRALKLAGSKTSLEKAGNRIDHVHPFKLLLTAFSDERMKVSMQQMQKGWGWKEFIKGLSESLDQEAKAGNLKEEYINEFAGQLKIDANEIKPLIRESKWKELVVKLTDLIPRSGDPDRYR